MHAVSDAYQKAIQDNTRSYYWTGKITLADGTEYPFENEDIVKGSGYVTRQCCGSNEIELGTVYAAHPARPAPCACCLPPEYTEYAVFASASLSRHKR